jgi:hypothetical protein
LWGTERAGLFKDDTEYYRRLAENLADPAHLPYTFRLLTPWIVSLLPMERVAGFTAVTVISLVSAAVLVYVFSARLGYSLAACAGALTVFLFSSVVIRMLTTPTYVDSLTYALSMASLLALLTLRDSAFCTLVTIGVFNRETALLLLPSYLAARWPVRGSAAWIRTGIVCAIPMAALAVLLLGKLAAMGLLVDPLEGVLSLNYTGYVQRVPRLGDLMDAFSLFGVAWAVLFLGWRSAPRWLLLYGALVLAQLLIARGDESRVLSNLFPLVIPLVARLLERARSLGLATMVALVLLIITSTVHFRWSWIHLDSMRYSLVAMGTIGGLALIVWIYRSERTYRDSAERIAGVGVRSGA